MKPEAGKQKGTQMIERSLRIDKPVDQLAEEVAEANHDPQTQRETLELELMEEGRSDEGAAVEIASDQRDD